MTRADTYPWQIWIDTGGTFTDGVAVAPDGTERRVKLLSSSTLRGTVHSRTGPAALQVHPGWSHVPGLVDGFRFRLLDTRHDDVAVAGFDPDTKTLRLDGPSRVDPAPGAAFELLSDEPAPVLAARLLTGTGGAAPLPRSRMRLATTLGTNALLERRGVPTALFITRGFGDLLLIGNQQRPELFRLDVRKPAPLHAAVVEVRERLDARGARLQEVDRDVLAAEAEALLQRGIRVAAVALMHGYLNPDHERTVKGILLDRGFDHVSCSHELAPRIKLLPRAETAVVDAYLAPVVRGYLDRVRSSMAGGDLLVMTSAGGLLDPAGFDPKDSLLSGPAGGVVGAALAGERCGESRVIGFDMGGTSTDVARFDGDYEYVFEHRVGDAHLVAPALAIESVAAGGGSVCWLDGQRLRVGPRSAGAWPGPACYGAGGPLTLTDVNLLTGRLDGSRFEIPIRIEPAQQALETLLDELERETGERPAPEEVLHGLKRIADETMADAIRRISVRRGYDPADHALVSFGGAGGQHALGVAEQLGMRRVIVPPDAALLSAVGLGHAVVERFEERQVLEPLDAVETRIGSWMDELAARAARAVAATGVDRNRIEIRRRILHVRFAGQDATLELEWSPGMPVGPAFEARYEELFGHRPGSRSVELESVRVIASSRPAPRDRSTASASRSRAAPGGRIRALFDAVWIEAPAHAREDLQPGATLEGPALIHERHSATVVESGWEATVLAEGSLRLDHVGAPVARQEGDEPEAIRLELFTQRYSSLVREMGERLERTAVSTNVKERLDFSCALLDPEGELVVNAPHIPVHLGALGLCVRRLKQELPMQPGDVVLTNHPACGGSHLPDVTVVTPVFVPGAEQRVLGYLASRAHHAEIGGSRPGSMPPDARCLAEEGVVLPPDYLMREGEDRWDTIRRRLEQAPYPTRNVDDNMADLRAAAAANHAGAVKLRSWVDRFGAPTILRYMDRLKRLAATRIEEALGKLPDGSYRAGERLDDGSALEVTIALKQGRAAIDFEGTAGVHPGNLNATPAIVRSAVLYVLRLMLEGPLPLNEGLLHAVSIRLPRGLLDPEFPDDPRQAPAVVGGNVETSQRLVDTLIKALGLASCSQGTMNNLIFGNESYGYYETLGGGCGAGPGFEGADGVHSHMTNTRITDPEILERRYPVRVERFAIRRGSGGGGRFRGGDGLIRELRFLEPATLSILSQHRVVAPYGLAGGEPGACGRQRVLRVDGSELTLGSVDGCEMQAGDRIVVETPGGGGYGAD